MGHVLFWLEAIITSVLFVALGLALSAGTADRLWRGLLRVVFALLALLPWGAVLGILAIFQHRFGGAASLLTGVAVAAGTFVVGAAVACWRGFRRVQGEPRRRAAAEWRLGRVALAWAAGVLLTCMTVWNLDLAVHQDMAALRVEAGTIALSVSPPRVPDSQNAALLYRQAAEILRGEKVARRNWISQVRDWLDPGKGAFDPNNGEMLAFLDKHAAVIDLLRRAGELPGCDFGGAYPPAIERMRITSFAPMRYLANLLCLSARVKVHRGRAVDSMKDLGAGFALAAHCTAEPTLFGEALAAEKQSFRTLQEVLAEAPPTGRALDALKLNPLVSFNDSLRRGVRMEEAFGLSMYLHRRVSTMVGEPDEDLAASLVDGTPYRVFLWRSDLAAYRRWMGRYQWLLSQPYYESREDWERLSERLATNRLGGMLVSLLLPGFGRTAELTAQTDAQHRLAILGVAMWRYRLHHGAFPDQLDLLAPEFIPAVPIDPFTGKSMTLHRTAGGKVVIYSLGPDLKDDGGNPWDRRARKGDVVLVLGK